MAMTAVAMVQLVLTAIWLGGVDGLSASQLYERIGVPLLVFKIVGNAAFVACVMMYVGGPLYQTWRSKQKKATGYVELDEE